ncbi:MAG: ABC transporter permease [Bacteroidales bacterium]|nr:ABC transporter permease [Bacteroidales bacterium]
MNKIWILFKREYRAAVRTKSFIISLLLVPIMMGGGFAAMIIMEKNKDTDDKKFVVIDHSGLMTRPVNQALETRNSEEIFHTITGEKIDAAYMVEFMEPDLQDPESQQLTLSSRVESQELHAFIEIGPGILHPAGEETKAYLKYYSQHSFNDQIRYWFQNVVNNNLRELRAAELNLDETQAKDLLWWINVEGMGLVTVDKRTGEQQEAEKTNELQSFLVPYVLLIMMFMLVMMSAIPQLSNVMEEKNEKIAEVLLGTITPFQFMMGKVMGGIGVSLTTAAIYVSAGVLTLNYIGMESLIPVDVLPWFFIFTILFILMVGSGMAALGATCNDNKDAQSLTFPGILPAIIPMFLIAPVIADPTGPLATTMALIPPFTPTVMVMRMASSVTIPMWQPVVGLIGVILYTIFSVWVGARIFRTAILIQGQKPTLTNLFKYAFKS